MLNKLRLLTPGPTPLPENVRLVLAKDMIHHRKSEFIEIMLRVEKKLQTLFGTKEVVLPLSCSGTGAMTAAVYSLFNKGEKVLVIKAGKFGERFEEIALSHDLDVEVMNIDWGKTVNTNDLVDKLNKDPEIKGVLVQLSETSTGVLHPIKEIAEKTRKMDVLLVVDGVSGVGLSPCPMDEWGIDCLLTGSQKGLMLPPGLALLALSNRAWAKVEKVKPCFYFNLLKEKKNILKGQTNFTSPVNLILGLDESLSMLLENGIETIYKKQWALTMMARNGAKAMGLDLFAPTNYAWGITSVCLPDGVDGVEVLKLAMKDHGVCLAGGQDHLKGKIIRIGHMGWIDWADLLAGLYAIYSCLIKVGGYSASRDYLEVAMISYQKALDGNIGEEI